MNTFITNLYEKMKAALQDLALSDNILQQSEQSYLIVQQALLELKQYIITYDFSSKAEEIQFFKEVKPMFLKELIFFMELYYTELNRPVSVAKQRSYFLKIQDNISSFFERSKVLYAYYRTRKTMYDELFFLRESNKEIFPLHPEYALDMDPQFSTFNSFKLAKIQAFELLAEHVQQVMLKLIWPEMGSTFPAEHKGLWTDSKAALIELAYALHSRGSVNHGKGDVKTIIACLETIFNIQTGNFYRAFQSMRIRKKNRTTYLDSLKESLERRMDETDTNFS